jgi:hypothetical protein
MSEISNRPVRERLLTVDEAAEYIGCSRSWFFRNVRPVITSYGLSKIQFSPRDLDLFVESRRKLPAGEPELLTLRARRPVVRGERGEAAAKKFGLE